MSQANFSNGAGGSINPSVFVVQDTTNPKAVNAASGTSTFIVGISCEYSKYAPIPNASTVAADTLGDPLLVYQEGDECLLTASTAGWTAGDLLTATTGGVGVTCSSGFYGAVGLTTMTTSGLGQVKVVTGTL